MCSFYGLNTTFSAFKSITNPNCVFISYTLQRLCDFKANYNKNKNCFIGWYLGEEGNICRRSGQVQQNLAVVRRRKFVDGRVKYTGQQYFCCVPKILVNFPNFHHFMMQKKYICHGVNKIHAPVWQTFG